LFVEGLRQLFAEKCVLFYGEILKATIEPNDLVACVHAATKRGVGFCLCKRPLLQGLEAVLAYLSRSRIPWLSLQSIARINANTFKLLPTRTIDFTRGVLSTKEMQVDTQ